MIWRTETILVVGVAANMSTSVKLLPLGALPPAVIFPLRKLIPVLCLGVGTSVAINI